MHQPQNPSSMITDPRTKPSQATVSKTKTLMLQKQECKSNIHLKLRAVSLLGHLLQTLIQPSTRYRTQRRIQHSGRKHKAIHKATSSNQSNQKVTLIDLSTKSGTANQFITLSQEQSQQYGQIFRLPYPTVTLGSLLLIPPTTEARPLPSLR